MMLGVLRWGPWSPFLGVPQNEVLGSLGRVAGGYGQKDTLGGAREGWGGLFDELLSCRFSCGTQAQGSKWAGHSLATASGSQP